jgi:superoxide dismutase, Fe-Mn family
MPYRMKPLCCDPARVKGMSERLIVSHYENNYGGAVKRLNLIDEQLAGLDYPTVAGFLVNGLKREQLIAMNSMILHELFFDGLGDQSEPGPALRDALARDFGTYERWRSEFIAMGKALGGGSGWVLLSWSPRDRKLVNQWARTIATHWRAARRCSRSICTSTPITWTSAPRPRATSTRSWTSFAGTMWNDCLFKRRAVKELGALAGNKPEPGGLGHACCSGVCDLRIGDGRHRRECPGD